MKNPNFLKPNKSSTETTWDSLREVPFRGEKGTLNEIKEDIKGKLINIRRMSKREPMTAQTFMLLLIGDLQSLLANNEVASFYDDFNFWKETLMEIKPILAGFWAECDPMIISYMFFIFVAQFVVILELWEQVDFSEYYISEYAMLGEYYMRFNMMQEELLTGLIKRCGLA